MHFNAGCYQRLLDRGVAEADLQPDLADGLTRLVEAFGFEKLRRGEACRSPLDTHPVQPVVDGALVDADLARDGCGAHPASVELDDLVVLAHSEARNDTVWRRVRSLDPFSRCTITEVAQPCYLWSKVQVAS